MRKAALISVLSLITLGAHDIITTKLTYTRDISRILARRCLSCHSSSASIPLTSYEEVRPWAVSIKEQVLSRQMPPWGAVKGFGHLSPDKGLTQEEIMIVAAWVIGGAPNGNPALLPTAAPKLPHINLPALEDVLVVKNRATINKPVSIVGIRPITDSVVESARVVVNFPDGHIEPLLWLFHYNPAWQQTFRFREPVALPQGSVVESAAPLQFALEAPVISH